MTEDYFNEIVKDISEDIAKTSCNKYTAKHWVTQEEATDLFFFIKETVVSKMNLYLKSFANEANNTHE